MKSLQTSRIVALSTVLVMLVMGFDACKHGEKNPPSEEELPSDLKIVFGLQGTFAGRSMGHTISGNGEVVRWEGKYPGENREATATVEPGDVRMLWKRAQEIGFLEMQEQAMATAYSFITLTADGESRRVTWVGRDETNPTPAQQFYDECMNVAKTALGQTGAGEDG